MKIRLQLILFGFSYCSLYFLVTTIIYFISVSLGFEGLGLPLFGGGDDGKFYYEQATNFAEDLPYVFTSIHPLILGWILKIFSSDSVYLLRFYNYIPILGLLLVSLLLLKKTVEIKKLFWVSSTILMVLLMCYPSLLLNTTLSLYRDAWIYFYFLWSIYLFSNIFISKGKYPKIINAFFLVFTLFMLGGYRKYALLSFLAGSLIYLTLKFLSRNRISLIKAMFFSVIGFSLFYLLLSNFKFPIISLSFSDVLMYRQSSLEFGGSQMGISLNQSNIVLFYYNYFYSLVSNSVGPLPWQVTGMSTLILILSETLVFLLIIIFLFRSRKRYSNLEKYFLIQSIIWFMLISISNDNLGTAARLRIVGWLPLLILFSKFFGEYLYYKLRLIRLSNK